MSVVVTRMTPESQISTGQLALEVRYSVLDVARFRDEFFAASGQHVASWQPLEEPQAKPLLKGTNAPQYRCMVHAETARGTRKRSRVGNREHVA